MSKLSMPELPRRSMVSSNDALPIFLQKPELRPTSPPVGVEYDRFITKTKKDKFDRITDCWGGRLQKKGLDLLKKPNISTFGTRRIRTSRIRNLFY